MWYCKCPVAVVSTSDNRPYARDSKLLIGRTNSCVKIPTTLKTSRCLVPLFLIRTGALQYLLVLRNMKFNKGYNLPVKLIFQELLKTAQYCGPSSCLHRASMAFKHFDMDVVGVMAAYCDPVCVCIVHCIGRHGPR